MKKEYSEAGEARVFIFEWKQAKPGEVTWPLCVFLLGLTFPRISPTKARTAGGWDKRQFEWDELAHVPSPQ